MPVEEIVKEADFETTLAANAIVVVDFYAVWCGPCKAIAPKLDTLSGTLEGKVKFIKVDVDKLGGLAQKKQVSAMPTFHVYVQETTDGQKKSVLKKSVVGANLPALTAAIDQYVREVAAAPAAASV